MYFHFEHMEKFVKLIEEKKFTKQCEPKNKTFILSNSVHLADLSNPTKPWLINKKWATLVVEEFFIQGDHEKRLGLPVGPGHD